MEPNIQHPSHQSEKPLPNKPDILSTCALLAGIFGITSCYPPSSQLLFGASAIILAILSKKEGHFIGISKIGLILGIISSILSVIIFLIILFGYQLLRDPANAEMIKQLMEQQEALLNSLQKAP